MNLRYEFNRIGHLFNDGVGKTQKLTGDWLQSPARRAERMARQLRSRADSGRRSIVSAEDRFARHMREYPAIYLMGAALIVGALIAKLVFEARERPQAPLL